MAFDQSTRNRLQNFVGQSRQLLTREFTRQLQNDYGMDPLTGHVSDMDRLTHLDDARRQTAHLLRQTLAHYQSGTPSPGACEAMERIVREQAFTALNRLCAVRMAEARGFVLESIGNGYHSKGFQLYARVAGTSLGETGEAYRCYLFSLFDELAVDLAVLFDRYSPMGRLFPRESTLLNLLEKINDPEIASLWAEDETIGWIYQYFNTVEERRKMRAESQAPRNSRELAVRNQFFTPRYVVEFLTDNTLGRFWYEMTKGATSLKESCRYLVRRPNEIFLAKGEEAPAQNPEGDGIKPEAEMTQEELLKQPVYIPHRPLKDPREILMIDIACGSMHFGLYSFDLFEKIYEEAWDMEESGQWPEGRGQESGGGDQVKKAGNKPLRSAYPSKEAFLRDVPKLIIEHNIHGVDIDPRAVQIAGLSLWLRAQRSWKEQGVKPADRPRILKSNIVCAEPMPGEEDLLKEFSQRLKPRVLGQLLEIIFDKMKLAGEAGSLLKIEEELEEAVEKAREAFSKELLRRQAGGEQQKLFSAMEKPKQQSLFDFADLPDKTRFWQTAQEKILDALRDYAVHAEAGDGYRRRLFADDAARGFAFIDICHKRFDVVLMNPPFGGQAKSAKGYLSRNYPSTWTDTYASFFERALFLLRVSGRLGCITSSTYFNLISFRKLRDIVLTQTIPDCLADLGPGVMDAAAVNSSACCYQSRSGNITKPIIFVDVRNSLKKDLQLSSAIECVNRVRTLTERVFVRSLEHFLTLPNCIFAYWTNNKLRQVFSQNRKLGEIALCSVGLNARGHDDRVYRAWWEVRVLNGFNKIWPVAKLGGLPNRFYRNSEYVVDWRKEGALLDEIARVAKGGCLTGKEHYFGGGFTYIYTGNTFSVQPLERDSVFTYAAHGMIFSGTNELALFTLLNSEIARLFLKTINPDRFFQTIYVRQLPIPEIDVEARNELSEIGKKAIKLKAKHLSSDECCRYFVRDWSVIPSPQEKNKSFFSLIPIRAEGKYKEYEDLIDQLNVRALAIYGVSKEDIKGISDRTTKSAKPSLGSDLDTSEPIELIKSLLSYLFGLPCGRWDIRYATGEKKASDLPDPFAPLPVCPPGMLQSADGLPAAPEDVSDDYPLRISWSGILVNDEGHGEDIVGRVREAMEVIWNEKAEDIEQEACEILGVGSLRDYFGKPAKFLADHLKRYSKSRRQAPIYWPLSTASGSYTLWIYYHRLTDQTLYTCVNDFVEPKLAGLAGELAELRRRRAGAGGKLPGAGEKEYTRLTDLELELKDFRDELLRIARFWKPDLNDGVQITASSLWKLFLYKPWQKKLKETWKKLEKGDYDWAHLAYSIWPDRVIRASHRDRSYAIAHDLEADLWEEVEVGTDRKGNPRTKWEPRNLSEEDLRRIINEKTGK